jgi:hypothetical protein
MLRSILFVLLFFPSLIFAQELRCKVTLNTDRLNNSDKSKFVNLETQIRDFMNNTRFSESVYAEEEKIDCNLNIVIENELDQQTYTAEFYIAAARPVYKTAYKAPLFKAIDNKTELIISESTRIEFTRDFYIDNLSSLLCFYGNMIVAYDLASFGTDEKAGNQFETALEIAKNAQSSRPEDAQWSATESNLNRFWLVTQILNPKYEGLVSFMYSYHMNVLDIMHKDTEKACTNLLEELRKIENLKYVSTDFFPKTYFETKAEEISNIVSMFESEEDKQEAITILKGLNPMNNSTYWNKLEKGGDKGGTSIKDLVPINMENKSDATRKVDTKDINSVNRPTSQTFKRN